MKLTIKLSLVLLVLALFLPLWLKGPSGQFYRWQDEHGVWHFSDQPPENAPASVPAEELPLVANSMEGLPPAPEPSGTGTVPGLDSSIIPSLPEGVSKEAIEELSQDAHEQRMGEEL